MAASKLSIYNAALADHLNHAPVASLSENVEARHALDRVWDNDFIDDVLRMGQWDFAARSKKVEASSSVTPAFGHTYAFTRQDDHIRTMAVCQDEYFDQPLLRYQLDGEYWYADITPIYIRYVSNDASYGGDLSLWPSSFTRFVEGYLAQRACLAITGDRDLQKELKDTTVPELLSTAKSIDAMELPSTLPPKGSWSRSRGRRLGDTGRRDRLIG